MLEFSLMVLTAPPPYHHTVSITSNDNKCHNKNKNTPR